MSDSHLRELERRWRESGELEDEVALLRERSRCGDLEPARLRLAAYVGHVAARQALGAEAPASPVELEDWVSDLGLWGSEVGVRAGQALAQLGRALWTRSETLPLLEELGEAATAWLIDPSPSAAARAAELADEHGDLPFTPGLGADTPGAVAAALAALSGVQEIRDAPSSDPSLYTPGAALKLADVLGEDPVRGELRSVLGAWALEPAS